MSTRAPGQTCGTDEFHAEYGCPEPGPRAGKRALVALSAAALTLGACAGLVPTLHTVSAQDSAAADAALSLHAAPIPVVLPAALQASVITPLPAKHGDSDASDSSDSSDDSDNADDSTTRNASKVRTGATQSMTVDLTGYSWFDNTPHGSAEVANPILHKEAGGTGTYTDPITVAVADGSFKAGTRFYVSELERYLIVEDSGASSGNNHLDVWVGGKGGSESGVSKCMDKFTGRAGAEINPPAGRPVLAGPIYGSGGCNLPGANKTDKSDKSGKSGKSKHSDD